MGQNTGFVLGYVLEVVLSRKSLWVKVGRWMGGVGEVGGFLETITWARFALGGSIRIFGCGELCG